MLHLILFSVFGLVCVAGAVNLLLQRHPINSALSLVVVMGSTLLGSTGVGLTAALSNYFYLHLWGLKSQAIGPLVGAHAQRAGD